MLKSILKTPTGKEVEIVCNRNRLLQLYSEGYTLVKEIIEVQHNESDERRERVAAFYHGQAHSVSGIEHEVSETHEPKTSEEAGN